MGGHIRANVMLGIESWSVKAQKEDIPSAFSCMSSEGEVMSIRLTGVVSGVITPAPYDIKDSCLERSRHGVPLRKIPISMEACGEMDINNIDVVRVYYEFE